MSTKPRIVAPDVIYKVSSTGVHELQMFKNDEIKTFFLKQLAKTLKKYNFTCHAFSISLNQYHMVLQSNKQSISLAMQHFNSILAKKINKVLGRGGTVFSSRFKSVIVEDDQLNRLVREVHLESVQLGEMSLEELEHYKFCSHSIFVGNSTSDLIDTKVTLKKMDIDSKEKYYQFIRDTGNIGDDFNSKLKDVNNAKQGFREPHLYVIGKPEFVKKVIELDNCRRFQIARYISENVKMETIHEKVVRLLVMENEDLFRAGQSNERSTGRELFVTICKSLSCRREIWDYLTDEASRIINSCKHSRGAGQEYKGGVSSVSWYCAGLSSGVGNICDTLRKAGVFESEGFRNLVSRLGRNKQNASWPDQITFNSPLKTNNYVQVKINGVDVFHPNTGEIISDNADGIACWFVDTDYNEESFFVRQAYFLGANDPYKSLKTTLKAEINQTLN